MPSSFYPRALSLIKATAASLFVYAPTHAAEDTRHTKRRGNSPPQNLSTQP